MYMNALMQNRTEENEFRACVQIVTFTSSDDENIIWGDMEKICPIKPPPYEAIVTAKAISIAANPARQIPTSNAIITVPYGGP